VLGGKQKVGVEVGVPGVVPQADKIIPNISIPTTIPYTLCFLFVVSPPVNGRKTNPARWSMDETGRIKVGTPQIRT
jgi:hypothetical protein